MHGVFRGCDTPPLHITAPDHDGTLRVLLGVFYGHVRGLCDRVTLSGPCKLSAVRSLTWWIDRCSSLFDVRRAILLSFCLVHRPSLPAPPPSSQSTPPLPPPRQPSPQLYQASLLRAVKKTAGEGLFPLFFVDSPHYSRRDLEDVWGAAKRAGFEAYVVDLFHVGLQVCLLCFALAVLRFAFAVLACCAAFVFFFSFCCCSFTR